MFPVDFTQGSFAVTRYSVSAGAGEDDEDLQEGKNARSPRMPRETTNLSERTIAVLREHLAWSQSSPLSVNVSIPSAASPTTPCLIPLIELLFSQSHRFKSLSTDVPVSVTTPDYKKLGNVRRLKIHIHSSFPFEALSLPTMAACHSVIEVTSFTSKPREKQLNNLSELVLESQDPIHAQDLQVPSSVLQLPATLTSLTIWNLSLSASIFPGHRRYTLSKDRRRTWHAFPWMPLSHSIQLSLVWIMAC
ncbi:hypothetical protein DFS33DRAFT_1365978 [Desarmillaria ectypa]|nr:hypothetical protein DFS33DRAFT_1365978 [Desarmillaria ectypa]